MWMCCLIYDNRITMLWYTRSIFASTQAAKYLRTHYVQFTKSYEEFQSVLIFPLWNNFQQTFLYDTLYWFSHTVLKLSLPQINALATLSMEVKKQKRYGFQCMVWIHASVKKSLVVIELNRRATKELNCKTNATIVGDREQGMWLKGLCR